MRRLLLSLLALSLLLVGVAAPASALATINSFTANGETDSLTVDPDAQIELEWNVTGDDDLMVEATGSWSGQLDPVGDRTVTGPPAGQTYTYRILASDSDSGLDQAITVTARDADPEPEGSTPPPVVVASCLVTVPESDDFSYELVYDGDPDDTEEIEAGTYTVSEVTADGLFEIEIVAVPGDGVVVAPGAPTSFEVPFSEVCASPGLFEATGGRCSFEVENVSDEVVLIQYGSFESEGPDGEFSLAAGQSRTVRTSRDLLIVVGTVGDPADEDLEDFDFQILPLEISQDDCSGAADGADSDRSGSDWAVPVNAPAAGVSAAGITTGQGTAPWLLAGLVIAGGLAAGSVRRRAAS